MGAGKRRAHGWEGKSTRAGIYAWTSGGNLRDGAWCPNTRYAQKGKEPGLTSIHPIIWQALSQGGWWSSSCQRRFKDAKLTRAWPARGTVCPCGAVLWGGTGAGKGYGVILFSSFIEIYLTYNTV